MPLYNFACPDHGTFESYVRVGGQAAPCPSCGVSGKKVFALTRFTQHRAYDQSIDGSFPNAHKPKIINRPGGGKAAQTATGGYRPMLTHHTQCPKEHKPRNVAVLANFPYGKRLACEACDYTWIYQEATAAYPLVNEVKETLRPPRTIHMNSDVPLHSGYVAPERGA